MAHPQSASAEALTLPPIDELFAAVLQRQLAQPASPPPRRPSAWPGFPGPDKDALLSSGYAGGTPPPPLQIGRRASVDSPPRDVLYSPSIFPSVHAWERHDQPNTRHNSRRYSQPATSRANEREWSSAKSERDDSSHQPQPGPSRIKRESWSGSTRSREREFDSESGRLPPISMTPSGSPRLYDRENPRHAPRPSPYPSCHCANDQQIEERRAAAIARGIPYSESPCAHKEQIPTPLPPAHGHIMIPFQPMPGVYPGRAFGVCMADILDFRPCLVEPDAPVLDVGMEPIFVSLEAKGYTTYVSKIWGDCPHRRFTRFHLAYAVACAYDEFLREFPFNPNNIKPTAIVVRSVSELRLVNLYSRDGGKGWRVHVAYCK